MKYRLKKTEILITPTKYIHIRGVRINKQYLGIGIAIILSISIIFAINAIKLNEMRTIDSSITIIVIAILGLLIDFFALIKKPKPTIKIAIDNGLSQDEATQSPQFQVDTGGGDFNVSQTYVGKSVEGVEGNVKSEIKTSKK